MRYFVHAHHVGGWAWVFPGITMLLFWAVLIALLVLLWRALGSRSRTASMRGSQPGEWSRPAQAPGPERGPASMPEQVLADRLARGEIEVEEYQRRLDALRAGGPPAA